MRKTLLLTSIASLLGATGFAFRQAVSDFTVVLFPDTQYYSLNTPNTYRRQTRWVADNETAENIKFAIHLGDITHTNTPAEWGVAVDAQQTLRDAGVRFSVLPGNHDYERASPERLTRNSDRYNIAFGPSDMIGTSSYGGAFAGKNDNNYTFFESEDLRFMVMSLEFAPTKDAVCWADSVIRRHPDRRVIVGTHCYTDKDGKHRGDCAKGSSYRLVGSSGGELWDELVSRHSNIFMTVSGHVSGAAHRAHARPHFGDVVHEMLVDYQSENLVLPPPVGTLSQNNGNGWMRTLRFRPQQNEIVARTFTVNSWVTAFNQTQLYGASPTHSDHAFTLPYDMSAPLVYRNHAGDGRFRDRTVNSESSGDQYAPAVASDTTGGFVVAWEDDGPAGNGREIYVRSFVAGGCQRTAQTMVNFSRGGQQRDPAVAMAPNGRFVVAWADDNDGNGQYRIYGRGFLATGEEFFIDRALSGSVQATQRDPAIAMDSAGNFVVVWEDARPGGGRTQIMARGFRADGTVRFGEMVVSATTGSHRDPAIGMTPDGSFVVAWADDADGNGLSAISARRYSAAGVGGSTIVAGASRAHEPSVAMNARGDFVVGWINETGGVFRVRASGFAAGGSTSFISITPGTSGRQRHPTVGIDESGRFAIAWEQEEGTDKDILMRTFQSNGSPLSALVAVSRDDRGPQINPVLSSTPGGKLIVSWQDDLDVNGHWDILARGFGSYPDASGPLVLNP